MSKKVEDIYKKVTQIEHILLRPDTYIGTIEANDHEMWIWEDLETMQFTYDTISYCNGLFKIFDEILVNAADNFQRDKKTDRISVTIENDLIIVENTGQGIPIEIHKEHKIYVPELIFGNLLTSSNYDDNEQKVTGGRNGFGAKLTNIFSSFFKVETTDKKQIFTMIWTDNMSIHTDPEIKPYNGQSFTRISFKPDLNKFKMDRLSDIYPLLYKRVMDIAGILPLKVYLNEKRLNIKNFSDYAQLYGVTKYASAKQHRWEVLVSTSDGQFQQVSFVNAINTSRGGTHVNYVTDKIVDALLQHIKKKFKEMKNLKPFQVKSNIKIFVNSLINNPSFDSQTKETLTTKSSLFGSTFELTDSFINQILKNTDIVDNILLSAKSKLNKQLSKQLSAKKQQRLLGIEKLEDANDAGTKYGDQCTLILTEGDSAKSLAMAGIEIVGRDKFGVFPLRGKLLNVRDAAIATLMKNQEIEQLVKIIGLQFNKSYENTKSLRYGSIMIMTDQDHDGHHIKGLIINLFDKFWPSLLKMKGFLKQFVTPIIKIQRSKDTHSFFSIGDYRKYIEEHSGEYKVKYYKGLGTSTDEEAQHYFSNLSSHRKTFTYVDQTDSDYIDLAFNKSKADQRKEWLSQYSWEHIQDTLDYSKPTVRYRNFITDCLSMHSVSDNVRSISSLVDGLKPTQRKIMHTLLNHAQTEQKVSSLSGIIMAYAQYHHGEQSLQSTIVAMAQKFTGSNNLNLLLPIGQFGTRSLLGKDAAQARYISSKLNPLSLKIFNEHDLHTLNYLDEEGHSVEPAWFVPILPLALLNGSDGIGTGWSTSIPPHNPREICEQIKRKLRGESLEELTPWYRGFTGQILAGNNQYIIKGSYIQNKNKVYITEIPPFKSIKEYQSLILSKMDGEDPEVLDLKEYHAGNKVCFEITLADKLINADIEKIFKLSTTQAMTNLVLFGANGLIKKYVSVTEIFEEFYQVRLDYYRKRKEYLLSKYYNELETLQQKIKFIQAMIDNTIPLKGQKKVEMCKILENQGFKGISKLQKIQSTKIKKDTSLDNIEKQYDYLLGMNIWSFSNEKITEINKKISQLEKQISELNKTTPEMLWNEDIDDFLQELDKIEYNENIDMIKRIEKNAEKLLKGGSKIIANIVKGRSNGDIDQDYQESEEDDSENENEKKNPKIIMRVIKEFANFGIISKREQQNQKLKYNEKKSKKEQQDDQIELEENMNKSKKAEKQDKLTRKNNKKIISESDESMEIDLGEEEEVVMAKKKNTNRQRKLQQNEDSDKVKEIKDFSERKEREQVKKEKEKVEKMSTPIEPLPLTKEEKDEQDLYKKYGLGDFLKYLSPNESNLADRLSQKMDKFNEALEKVRQEENVKSSKKEQKQNIIQIDDLDIENLDFNIEVEQPKQQQSKNVNPIGSNKKKKLTKQDSESSFEVMDKKQKKKKA